MEAGQDVRVAVRGNYDYVMVGDTATVIRYQPGVQYGPEDEENAWVCRHHRSGIEVVLYAHHLEPA